jgi:DNA topoisomerase-2
MQINLNDYDVLDIDNITTELKNTTMYDIEVEDDNTFFISKNKTDNILVHNCDGSHIKGLIINLIDTYWPELLEMDFIYEFITPIVKIEKGTKIKYFYRIQDYQKWKENPKPGHFIKWIKGLGTIEPKESKLFFKDISKHLIRFNASDIKAERNLIDLAFKKKRADDRKNWLLNYTPGIELDKFKIKQTYKSFFDNEFIEYSMSDNIRSIPSMVDGLKPSQRKILYTLFKRKFKNEVKVELLMGSILELSAYHHGPKSLETTIVGMAQNFVGSNNINLLKPKGEYGTRSKGGSDASASRYIFTNIEDITRNIFQQEDDEILEYLTDDGYQVEPKYYAPIIPMVLVNGSDGIGTGWSSYVPQFNPTDIITYIENKLKEVKKQIKLTPWFKGFKGEILEDLNNSRYISRGIFKKLPKNKLNILELPIYTWNDNYYKFLDKLIDDKYIKDYDKYCTDENVNIVITIPEETFETLTDDIIINKFNLESYINMNNMNLFDENGKIYYYKDQYDIIDKFINLRIKYYELRKQNLLNKLEIQKKYTINKMKFINCILKKEIIFENKTKDNIIKQIELKSIEKHNESYDYLINTSLISLSKEKLLELKEQFNKIKIEIENIKSITEIQMWLNELSQLKNKLK